MAIKIGKLTFPTQSAASRYFDDIKNKYKLGDTVAGSHVEALYNLLEHQSDRGAPKREQVDRFIVDLSKWKKLCFVAITKGGRKVALSASRSAAHNETPVGAAK